jgi:hypothetical protein
MYRNHSEEPTVRGCRVSTDEQVDKLQAEVSVCTLVKQPTKQ